ncbi:MAG TPA: hypothetical protein VF559_06430 [Caulobacteraceae bacterium]
MQDNIGLAFGLRNSRIEGKLADEASTYLKKHTELFQEQMDDLRRNEVSDVLGVVLQVFSILAALAVAGFLAVAVWQAVHSKTLVIEPISAPEDIQKNGLTPPVLSMQLLDQLRVMQDRTDSSRAPGTYSNSLGEDIQIEIPQTGMSVGEALRILRRWLGKDIHISGEVWRAGKQTALSARVRDFPAETFRTDKPELEPLMQQAALSIYAKTQPYRYSVYLWQNDRQAEAIKVLQQQSREAPRGERAWAFVGLSGMYSALGNLRLAAVTARKGLALNPNLASGWKVVGDSEYALGHDEAMLAAYRAEVRALDRPDGGGVTAAAGAQNRLDAQAAIAEALGDWRNAAATLAGADNLADYQGSAATASVYETLDRIRAHEPVNPWTVSLDAEDDESPVARARLVAASAEAKDDWRGVAEALERIQAEANHEPGVAYRAQLWPTQVWPLQAYAYARAGRIDQARRLIARTPGDCYLCLRARARIEALAGDRRGSDAWFARAVAAAPSLPFAYGEWGQALAARGDHRAAAGKFKLAASRGKAWPEVRLWWGRSLLAQGRREDAARQLRLAADLAPRWAAPRRLLAQAEDGARR